MRLFDVETQEREGNANDEDPEFQLDLGPPTDSRSRRRKAFGQNSATRLLSLEAESDMWQTPDIVDPKTRIIARASLIIITVSFRIPFN